MENYGEHFIIASDNKIYSCTLARAANDILDRRHIESESESSSEQRMRSSSSCRSLRNIYCLFAFERYHDCMSMSDNSVARKKAEEIIKHTMYVWCAIEYFHYISLCIFAALFLLASVHSVCHCNTSRRSSEFVFGWVIYHQNICVELLAKRR